MIKNRLHKAVAFLLVVALAFVQLVLVNHRAHHSVKSSADREQVHAFAPQCEVCDYMFAKRSDSAILSQSFSLDVFKQTIDLPGDENIVPLPFSEIDQYSNKGPPALG